MPGTRRSQSPTPSGVRAPSPSRRRAFFALPPDAPLQHALAAIAADVAITTGGRATRADSIHLTLAFVGDVGAAQLDALTAIGDALQGSAFTLTLERLGVFERANVAWIAPQTTPPALAALHRALSVALAQGGFSVERRAFAPHVTLARHCSTGAAVGPRDVALVWPVSALALWASATVGAGRYDEIARWPLI